MAMATHVVAVVDVALRKESVDRNKDDVTRYKADAESLSARRAWIEILMSWPRSARAVGRSPQGERG